MKDYLHTARFINAAPRNPTQTRYTRFLKGPVHPMESMFTRAGRDWQKRIKDATKTRYSEWLD